MQPPKTCRLKLEAILTGVGLLLLGAWAAWAHRQQQLGKGSLAGQAAGDQASRAAASRAGAKARRLGGHQPASSSGTA